MRIIHPVEFDIFITLNPPRMNPILRNILAGVAGIIAGSVVNMGIITISGAIIPPPDGVDLTTAEGLKAAMPLFQPKHFIMPFLAHALGTLSGAVVAVLLATGNKLRLAMIVGAFFLIGGISAVAMIPAPMWFNVLDLVVAYIPMAYLGWKLAARSN
jgi:hypothetical protein